MMKKQQAQSPYYRELQRGEGAEKRLMLGTVNRCHSGTVLIDSAAEKVD